MSLPDFKAKSPFKLASPISADAAAQQTHRARKTKLPALPKPQDLGHAEVTFNRGGFTHAKYWYAGARACRHGRKITSCTIKDPQHRAQWLAGFEATQK